MADIRPTTGDARRPALLLAALLFGSGVLHFAAPKFYDSIVPRLLPGRARDYTYASGIAELGVAVALAAPRTRRLGGRLAALLFVAIFPANVQMAVDVGRSEKASRALKVGTLLRLPLQIPLVTTALKVSRSS
ncbi:DoxX family protein [Nocardia lijiangensis]|uniref:DoxX family protein n=1 Tax=Nocardia lijiangensis TaxID=299618 RepID=UPI003D716B55